MRGIVLFSLVFISFALQSAADGLKTGCQTDVVQAAQENYGNIFRAVEIGTMASTEADRAKLLLFEMQYCAGYLSLQRACESTLPLQKNILNDEFKKLNLGASTAGVISNEISHLAALEESCSGK